MKKQLESADFIEPLHINGMSGRVLHMPPPSGSQREIIVIYGHHSSLERWWGLAQNLNDFGGVIMPDLPGFGGMDSFFSIGRKATLDDYADYMAAFVKLRCRRRKVVIVGISFGFLVATRMLQRYPELTAKVEMLVSAAGFMRSDNFIFTKRRYNMYLNLARVFQHPPLPAFFHHVMIAPPVLRAVYARTHNAKHKFKLAGADQKKFDQMMEREIALWHDNDARTYMATTVQLLRVDNCQVKVPLPIWHVYTPNDNYFDHSIIEQQMQVVFSEYHSVEIKSSSHVPSVIADKEEASVLIPDTLRRALGRSKAKKR